MNCPNCEEPFRDRDIVAEVESLDIVEVKLYCNKCFNTYEAIIDEGELVEA